MGVMRSVCGAGSERRRGMSEVRVEYRAAGEAEVVVAPEPGMVRVKECPFCGGMPVVERRVVDLGWSGIRTMMVLRCEKWDCPAGTGGCERFTFESAAVGWNTRKVVGDE